ncbi:MAG: response regulator transcription factor [Deltaproteobacteria bacterium]|nr:response regulator transcription factor [Deltaproteobacteria bacterium]
MNGPVSNRVLVVEDDPDIARLLMLHLRDLGYEVDHCSDGQSGLEQALNGSYELIILDLMLPKMDGYEVCKRIRKHNTLVLILILTLKSEVSDKILGLELGADDYLTKPFSIQELQARINALFRRSRPATTSARTKEPTQIRIKDLLIEISKRKVKVAGREVELTRKEFDLLLFLARNPGRVHSRDDLLNWVWGYNSTGYEHTIDTHINRLRSKIESNPATPKFILTVWGVGYRFAESVELK